MSAPWCGHTKGAAGQYCCEKCLKCGVCCTCPPDGVTGKIPALISSISRAAVEREREMRRGGSRPEA